MIRTKKLKDITIKIGSGATPSGGQSSYHNSGVALIRSQNVLDFEFSTNGLAFIDTIQAKELNNVTVKENDILLNITGDSIARVCIVPENILPARVNQHVAIIRCDNTVNTKYVYYYLLYLKSYLLKICGVGGTRNALTKVALEKIEIAFQENQKGRAAILSSLDSKIELNNRINAELEEMVKTLYDYWFVQFDFPNAKGKPYKTSEGKMVWNEVLKREVPNGWEVIKMSELYDFQYGFGNVNPANGGAFPVYGSNGVIGYYDKFNNEDSPVIGHIGNNCGSLVFADGKHYVTYNGVMCKIKNHFDKYFGYVVLQSKDLKSHTRGSSQQFISYDILNSLDVVIPENGQMKVYCDLINPLFDQIINNKKQNQQLSALRDWLLPMLMNGQVKVGDREEDESLPMAAEPEVMYSKRKK